MFLFFSLQQKLAQYLTAAQVVPIVKAFLLSADAHENQFRSSREPYIVHPVAVAVILADLRMDPETIIASLLHDVVEDTEYTLDEIKTAFGGKVAELVNGVTKLLQIKFSTKAEAQAENFRKMILAMVEDIRVIIIKLADRMHNMRTLSTFRPEKCRRIAVETLEIYAPIANRLGMHDFRTQLEDDGFRAMYPLRYKILKKYVAQARGNRQRLFDKILSILCHHLANAGIDAKKIQGRQKRLYSIYRKMWLKGLPFSEIMDVYAYRIIADDTSTCYQLLGIVHSVFKPVPGRFKDYIAIPKMNGYQSLHTILFGPHGVPIEIQIRTAKMDDIADNGIAAHWLYKSIGYVSATEVKTREWLKQLLDIQQHAGTSMDFLENVKIDLYPDEVYVFTPQGDILELPKGATPIDFAYAVHTEVGDRCVAAKVNRQHVTLSYLLRSGQTVDIITSATAHPSASWLNFVIAGKAKGAIKHYLKQQQDVDAVRLGQQILQSALSKAHLSLDNLSETVLQLLLVDLKVKTLEKLLAEIGLGERSGLIVATQIANLLQDNGTETSLAEVSVNITGVEGLSLCFSECCLPIPGDAVMGVVQKGEGIIVHVADCEAVRHYQPNQHTFVNLTWSDNVTDYFKVRIKIEMKNITGSLGKITTMLASQNADIRWVTFEESEKNYATIIMIINVNGRRHLAQILRYFKRFPFVFRAFRLKKNETSGSKN